MPTPLMTRSQIARRNMSDGRRLLLVKYIVDCFERFNVRRFVVMHFSGDAPMIHDVLQFPHLWYCHRSVRENLVGLGKCSSYAFNCFFPNKDSLQISIYEEADCEKRLGDTLTNIHFSDQAEWPSALEDFFTFSRLQDLFYTAENWN